MHHGYQQEEKVNKGRGTKIEITQKGSKKTKNEFYIEDNS